MKPTNFGVACIPAAAVASTGTAAITFDHTGYDYAVFIMNGLASTAGETWRTVTLKESDTSTVHTSMTTVAGANFATTTTTNATASVPAATIMGTGAAIVFQVDLRKRAKYVSVGVTPGADTAMISMTALLLQPDQSKDTATQKYLLNSYSLATTILSVAGVSTF